MIPAGYMAKIIVKKPDLLKAKDVQSIYSVSGCISKDFADYDHFWKHNKFWFFDSVEIIKEISKENNVNLSKAEILYYEIYEKEFDEKSKKWNYFENKNSFGYLGSDVKKPENKYLLGYDIVNYIVSPGPECSVFSCNYLAENVKINKYCLMDSFEETKEIVETLGISKCEPGPYRIFAVYKID